MEWHSDFEARQVLNKLNLVQQHSLGLVLFATHPSILFVLRMSLFLRVMIFD